MVVGDDHLHQVLALVEDDLRDLGRREGPANELGWIRRIVDDVNLLAAQFLHDRLDPRTAHADAGADRVDLAVMRHDRDLGAPPRLPNGGLDLDDPLVDLGDLLPEEFDEQVRVGPAQDDLRALRGQVDVVDVGPNTIALPVALAWNLLLLGEDGVGAPEVHDDVLLLEALHRAGEDLALAVLELVVDDLPLGIADLLDDALFRRLGSDAAVDPR